MRNPVNFLKHIINKLMTKYMQSKGYSPYFAPIVFKKRFNDLFRNKETSWKQKIWAQKRGFLSGRIAYFGLTEENFRDYLPDFDYYRLFPINGRFSHWIDDKLTMKLILHPFSQYLPEYYYHITEGEILCLMDCPIEYENEIVGIINLIRQKKHIAAKLTSGSKGVGFYKLSYEKNNYYINDEISTQSAISNLLVEWKKNKEGDYLITEYITPHQDLKNIWSKTPNALRLLVVRKKNDLPIIAYSYIRFGTIKTGVIDNSSSGGITCKVDLHSGKFSNGKILVGNLMVDCNHHPDTNILLEGQIPFWDLIKSEIINIGKYLPQLIYIGYDIAIIDDGFKIIEMNSHPGLGFEQLHNSIFKNDLTSEFFEDLLK